ncbi:expressed hypothetical protein [Trichoplax adhaerens]|uniref:Major facilitator superfamily (MFS) profile domain-containing protein n=1 Tax=Trichoplax adhaerens TaxID=10228 RepID=B3S799_TRIAD|nr:expressed hypothetical protein [Trichoplax adhaerens]EDV21449.1 expressed hypothetical protein [Trichoplax adhaerens]|eukprot:XP_002116049.1 expressed hypothetical protein [Trichoplax adhaerens]
MADNEGKPRSVAEVIKSSVKVPITGFVIFFSIFATIGGFLFGYDIGIIGGVTNMRPFRISMGLPPNSTEGEGEDLASAIGIIVSSFSLGCMVGALSAGWLSDVFGRKMTVLVGSTIFTVGGVFQGAAIYLWMMIVGRVAAGLGVGIMSMVVPLFNAEISPKELRGRLVSLQQLSITFGIMISFLVNLAVEGVEIGWRISLGLQSVFSIILVIGMLMLPESPRWLVKNGETGKALSVLQRLRAGAHGQNANVAQEELDEIVDSIEAERAIGEGTWNEVFCAPDSAKRVVIGCGCQFFQQFSGINVVMYYSPIIFDHVGVPPLISTAVVGVINFLSTFIALYIIDKVGRKFLMLVGAIGMVISLFFAGALIYAVDVSQNVGVGIVIVVLVCLYVNSFAYSWGPCAWVITSEIFPLRLRGKAVSITTLTNWIGVFVVAQITPLLLQPNVLNVQGMFILMGVFCTAAFFFTWLLVPETKGVSLEAMGQLFKRSSWFEITRPMA